MPTNTGECKKSCHCVGINIFFLNQKAGAHLYDVLLFDQGNDGAVFFRTLENKQTTNYSIFKNLNFIKSVLDSLEVESNIYHFHKFFKSFQNFAQLTCKENV